ncbi:MAG TPA: hypothetical protein VK702_08085 [Candidatus Acidoferrum sp.]|jgi:uncharacterized membrane protein|nr:hypothetical protein [Candidatus Acidoferrum sp.]
MAIVTDALAHPGLRSYSASLDIESPVEDAFALLCAVEKWPVWLPFLRSATLAEPASPLSVGTEVIVRSSLPRDEEQRYEVDQLITNFHLSLVGAYSVRRRLDFRIERKTSRAKLHVKLSYPAYGGRLGALMDAWKHGRRFERGLDDALVHFKGMVELAVIDRDC